MSTEPGSDPIGDFQRWLMKAGARSIGKEVAGRVKSTLGGSSNAKHADVWETATTEEPDEPPECQWCPICRAARRYREGGGSSPTLSGQFAGVSDTLAGLTRDAFSLFEAAMRPPQRPADRPAAPGSARSDGSARSAGPAASAKPTSAKPAPAADSGASTGDRRGDQGDQDLGSDDGTVVGSGVGWPGVVHPQHEHDEAAHEGGDREEGGKAGDGRADGGTDEQVERPAE